MQKLFISIAKKDSLGHIFYSEIETNSNEYIFKNLKIFKNKDKFNILNILKLFLLAVRPFFQA